MRAKKQEKRIEAYLNLHGSITPMEAWRECGVYRLADVIFKLRRKYYNIKTERIERDNQFGEKVNFANYRLV